MQVGEWAGQDRGPLDETSQEILRPDAYMGRIYVNADEYPVDVSVVYGHAKETFHSPGFCLLGGGWNIIEKARRGVECGPEGDAVLANEFLLQREGEQRVVLYWYASHRETTPSWVVLQYRLLRNRVLRRPMGGALVRVTAPVAGSVEGAARTAEDLIRELYPELREAMAL
jgi:EpsI family protein